jgi:hypothetical protein
MAKGDVGIINPIIVITIIVITIIVITIGNWQMWVAYGHGHGRVG